MKNNFLKIVMFLIFGFGFSQTPISLENAINKAFSNNLNIKSGELKINYQEKLKGSAVTIDPLNISAEIGQIILLIQIIVFDKPNHQITKVLQRSENTFVRRMEKFCSESQFAKMAIKERNIVGLQ
jgi:hypothetical protein